MLSNVCDVEIAPFFGRNFIAITAKSVRVTGDRKYCCSNQRLSETLPMADNQLVHFAVASSGTSSILLVECPNGTTTKRRPLMKAISNLSQNSMSIAMLET